MAQTIEELYMGSALISSWIAIALSGAILPQAYAYFCGRPQNDHKIIGPLIIILLLLDMAHVACIMATLYHYLIRDFGNNNGLAFLIPPLACLLTDNTLHYSFFTWRVWKLSRKNPIAPVIFCLQIARLTCGWVTTIKAINYGTFDAWTHQVRWIFTAGVAIAVVCDILITGSLCYWLHDSRKGLHGMNEMIDKIILYSIENGALTCVASIASLICAIIMPGNLIFIGIHFVISKLYINSVLASLNARNTFRTQKERQARKAFQGLFIDVTSAQGSPGSIREQNTYALQSPKSATRGESLRFSESIVSVKGSESSPSAYEFVVDPERAQPARSAFVAKDAYSN